MALKNSVGKTIQPKPQCHGEADFAVPEDFQQRIPDLQVKLLEFRKQKGLPELPKTSLK